MKKKHIKEIELVDRILPTLMELSDICCENMSTVKINVNGGQFVYVPDKPSEDLLAQKEDKKECKHIFTDERLIGSNLVTYCIKCGKINPIPSPLEIEEIEEISKEDIMTCSTPYLISELQYKQCQLIRNQKKLYQFIKEKL